jgi:hypothetical protein
MTSRTNRAAPSVLLARHTLPVVGHHQVRLDECERLRLNRLASRLLTDEPSLADSTALVERGIGDPDGPALFLEDRSAVPLLAIPRQRAYQYRSLLLAGDHDQVLIQGRREPAFEAYCDGALGLGRAEVVRPRSTGSTSLVAATLGDTQALERLVAHARRFGSLTVVPYMGTKGVWLLAKVLAERAGVPVRVAAPSSRLTMRANNKLWFSQRLIEVLGRGALPLTYAAFAPRGLAQRVLTLAQHHESIVLKIPDSLGSLGNIVLRSNDVTRDWHWPGSGELQTLLRATGWSGSYPVLVGVWDEPVVDSPSVQLWIPDRNDGHPVVEGIFSQVVAGVSSTFVGASSCELPLSLQRRLAEEAAHLGYLLQQLGYYGRCSFDAVVAGEDPATSQLHWVECNARWGGVSIPMTLANRLVGDWAARWFAVVQERGKGVTHVPFKAALGLLGDRLFTQRSPTGRIVLLSPSRVNDTESGPHFLVLAHDAAEAAREITGANMVLRCGQLP